MIGYDGSVKVADFGIAKASHTAIVTQWPARRKGKVGYMAPEQCTGANVDRRKKRRVPSSASWLWELVFAVRRLYNRVSDSETMRSICYSEVPKPSGERNDLPASVEAIVLKALAHEPQDRFQSADEDPHRARGPSPPSTTSCPSLPALAGHIEDAAVRLRAPSRAAQRHRGADGVARLRHRGQRRRAAAVGDGGQGGSPRRTPLIEKARSFPVEDPPAQVSRDSEPVIAAPAIASADESSSSAIPMRSHDTGDRTMMVRALPFEASRRSRKRLYGIGAAVLGVIVIVAVIAGSGGSGQTTATPANATPRVPVVAEPNKAADAVKAVPTALAPTTAAPAAPGIEQPATATAPVATNPPPAAAGDPPATPTAAAEPATVDMPADNTIDDAAEAGDRCTGSDPSRHAAARPTKPPKKTTTAPTYDPNSLFLHKTP